ncbi:MAG: FxsB family radical SAM/SPASM domain protein [Alphaproteobacteria bacterium]|nr:FxsB family radical SAM/SPASM domain protein [Alphaproteobacteria bacterium]
MISRSIARASRPSRPFRHSLRQPSVTRCSGSSSGRCNRSVASAFERPLAVQPEKGAMSIPFSTFVVKVASRCNLNCDYCYMYNLEDRTYRNQPAVLTDEVARNAAGRIAAHAVAHDLGAVHFIMHGGEPLLAGKRRIARIATIVRELLALHHVQVRFSMQSNGMLIDDEWIELLADHAIRIGVSVDGPREVHDQHRLDHFGNGSFDRVIGAIDRLKSHPRGPEIFSNVLAVVDTDIDPETLLEFWDEIDVVGFDLSLPHANHLHPPPAPIEAYRDWLIAFFDGWFDRNKANRHVRYFENMMRMMFGCQISTDNIGGKPVDVLVIETDGSLEPTDAFKCCFDGVTKLGANLATTALDELADNPLIEAFQNGSAGLCKTCQSCEARDICGGGYMPHRFGTDGSFDHPSVYCGALKPLVHHIHGRIKDSLPAQMQGIAA